MDELLTPAMLCQKVPETSEPYWAQLRFRGTGPRYLKPSPKKVLYKWQDVEAWLEGSGRNGTAEVA
jgi:hypothetical protein